MFDLRPRTWTYYTTPFHSPLRAAMQAYRFSVIIFFRFILKEDNCLYYYKQSKDKTPCGVIVLCNYSVTKAPDSSKRFCFKLNKGGARTYHFCASDGTDMRDWMIALMKSASAVYENGVSVSESCCCCFFFFKQYGLFMKKSVQMKGFRLVIIIILLLDSKFRLKLVVSRLILISPTFRPVFKS